MDEKQLETKLQTLNRSINKLTKTVEEIKPGFAIRMMIRATFLVAGLLIGFAAGIAVERFGSQLQTLPEKIVITKPKIPDLKEVRKPKIIKKLNSAK